MIYFLLYILIGSVIHGVLKYLDGEDLDPGIIWASIIWPILIPYFVSIGVSKLLKKIFNEKNSSN